MEQRASTPLRSFDRINNYLSFSEIAMLEVHRIASSYDLVILKWLRGEQLLSDEEKIVSEFLRAFSTMRYWLSLSYEFLDFMGYTSSLAAEEKELLTKDDLVKALDCLNVFRRIFIKLQNEFERYCREEGIV